MDKDGLYFFAAVFVMAAVFHAFSMHQLAKQAEVVNIPKFLR